MKNKGFVIGVIVVAVLGFIFLMQNKKSDQQQPEQAQTTEPGQIAAEAEAFVRPHSPRIGNSIAKVTVVEWLDPECEGCREMHPYVKKVINEYKDRVLFVVRYMPYHGNSMYAASLLEEAKDLGKFEEALDIVFEHQPEWGSHHQPRPELLPGYLGKLGIPADAMDREKVIAKHGSKIEQDKVDGEKVGVNGTPTFYVNQRPLPQLSEGALRTAIENELKK